MELAKNQDLCKRLKDATLGTGASKMRAIVEESKTRASDERNGLSLT